MKILVTGGAGFIGSHLIDRLQNQGHDVRAVDNLSAGKDNVAHLRKNRVPLHRKDIGNYREIVELFEGIDTVFHLAAMNRAGRSIADPLGAHQSNATGTLNVFEAARQQRVKKVIFVSSSSVLGGSEGTLTESTPYNPLHPYGGGKAMGEMYAKIYADLYDLDVTTLRYFSIYGPRQKGNLDYPAVIAKFVMQALDGQPLSIYGDGRQLRNYTYVDDAVEATIKAAESANVRRRILHVANDNEYSIHDIVESIKKHVKNVEVAYQPLVAPEPRRNYPDINQTKKLLAWSPTVSLDKGIKFYIDWYTSQVKKSNENREKTATKKQKK